MWIIALILALPLIEIGLFVTLGGALGLWLTLALVLGSTLLGVAVLRRGAGMRRPGGGMMQLAGSGLSAVAAILLILPGFLTSFLGLLLLLPVVQRAVIALVGQRLAARGLGFQTGRPPPEDVIEGDYTVVKEPREGARAPSKWTRH